MNTILGYYGEMGNQSAETVKECFHLDATSNPRATDPAKNLLAKEYLNRTYRYPEENPLSRLILGFQFPDQSRDRLFRLLLKATVKFLPAAAMATGDEQAGSPLSAENSASYQKKRIKSGSFKTDHQPEPSVSDTSAQGRSMAALSTATKTSP
jgi:hypothetical protein